jgi:hypothetical protein
LLKRQRIVAFQQVPEVEELVTLAVTLSRRCKIILEKEVYTWRYTRQHEKMGYLSTTLVGKSAISLGNDKTSRIAQERRKK